MNGKLLFKTVFLIVLLLLLVLIGMHNREMVSFKLPPILVHAVKCPAAIMYFAFFAVGVLAGTVLTAGPGGWGRSTRTGKDGK